MMREESKSQKAKVENLELNRETVQDLTEQEGGQAKGGLAPIEGKVPNTEGLSCAKACTGWGGPVGDTNRCVC